MSIPCEPWWSLQYNANGIGKEHISGPSQVQGPRNDGGYGMTLKLQFGVWLSITTLPLSVEVVTSIFSAISPLVFTFPARFAFGGDCL